ncbi:MAG: hypothetical protein KAJ60_11495 [Desulfobulbaceae bacterium]|nr:hypothetical protein [Desulfobulbaceae bacterium]MCK5403830.1 hypothetical protein [Desulfobulbaceae bacterium]
MDEKSDLDKYKDLFKNFGVRYDLFHYTDQRWIVRVSDDSPAVTGSPGTGWDAEFTKEGKFIQILIR